MGRPDASAGGLQYRSARPLRWVVLCLPIARLRMTRDETSPLVGDTTGQRLLIAPAIGSNASNPPLLVTDRYRVGVSVLRLTALRHTPRPFWLALAIAALVIGAVVALAAPKPSTPQRVSVGAGLVGFSDGSCAPATTTCIEIGTRPAGPPAPAGPQFLGVISRRGGSVRHVPSGDVVNGAVWCRQTTLCWLVGAVDKNPNDSTLRAARGAIFSYRNGAIGPPKIISGVKLLLGASSCPTDTTCWLTAQTNSATRPWAIVRLNPANGATRTYPLAAPAADVVFGNAPRAEGLWCASSNVCLSVGETKVATEGVLTMISAGRVVRVMNVAGASILSGIDCRNVGDCLITGTLFPQTRGSVSTRAVLVPFTRGTTSPPIPVPQAGGLVSVRCTTGGRCLAAGRASSFGNSGRGILERTTSTGFTAIGLGTPSTHLDAFVCPSGASCWAVGAQSVGPYERQHEVLFLTPVAP